MRGRKLFCGKFYRVNVKNIAFIARVQRFFYDAEVRGIAFQCAPRDFAQFFFAFAEVQFYVCQPSDFHTFRFSFRARLRFVSFLNCFYRFCVRVRRALPEAASLRENTSRPKLTRPELLLGSYRVARRACGRIRPLQVKTAAGAVRIENFAREINVFLL